eukprot:XP_025007678.1 uncharacterized protein LOC112532694 [Gallus gallus]
MAGGRFWPWMGLAWMLVLAQLGALPLTSGPRDEVQAAALQRLREVFDIEELPPDVLPRKKPPQFMVDLFNKVADANGITRAPGLLEGDVVRSFEDRAPVEQDRFFFDVSAMERGEQVLKAELRVFKLRRRRVARRADPQHFCKVEVYELLEGGSNPHKKNLIASRLLSLYSEGWEVFNVTQTTKGGTGEIPSYDPPRFPQRFPGVPDSRASVYKRRARRDVGTALTAVLLTRKGVTPHFSRQDVPDRALTGNAGRAATSWEKVEPTSSGSYRFYSKSSDLEHFPVLHFTLYASRNTLNLQASNCWRNVCSYFKECIRIQNIVFAQCCKSQLDSWYTLLFGDLPGCLCDLIQSRVPDLKISSGYFKD